MDDGIELVYCDNCGVYAKYPDHWENDHGSDAGPLGVTANDPTEELFEFFDNHPLLRIFRDGIREDMAKEMTKDLLSFARAKNLFLGKLSLDVTEENDD
jgi:NMD protein affecting ribosome stability and mRNA decay